MDMTECVFCKIINNQIPATKHYEDADVVVFDDLSHEAPVHVLVIPKQHLKDLTEASVELVGKLQMKLPEIARTLGIGEAYRVSLNAGRYQEVPHLHYHLKGGE